MNLNQQEIEDILANPIYTGLGPYPDLIETDIWIETAIKRVKVDGLEHAIEKTTRTLRNTEYISELPNRPEHYIIIAQTTTTEQAFKQIIADAKRKNQSKAITR